MVLVLLAYAAYTNVLKPVLSIFIKTPDWLINVQPKFMGLETCNWPSNILHKTEGSTKRGVLKLHKFSHAIITIVE